MTPEDSERPNRPLSFLRHDDGSWNLLPILAGALGVVFVAFMLVD